MEELSNHCLGCGIEIDQVSTYCLECHLKGTKCLYCGALLPPSGACLVCGKNKDITEDSSDTKGSLFVAEKELGISICPVCEHRLELNQVSCWYCNTPISIDVINPVQADNVLHQGAFDQAKIDEERKQKRPCKNCGRNLIPSIKRCWYCNAENLDDGLEQEEHSLLFNEPNLNTLPSSKKEIHFQKVVINKAETAASTYCIFCGKPLASSDQECSCVGNNDTLDVPDNMTCSYCERSLIPFLRVCIFCNSYEHMQDIDYSSAKYQTSFFAKYSKIFSGIEFLLSCFLIISFFLFIHQCFFVLDGYSHSQLLIEYGVKLLSLGGLLLSLLLFLIATLYVVKNVAMFASYRTTIIINHLEHWYMTKKSLVEDNYVEVSEYMNKSKEVKNVFLPKKEEEEVSQVVEEVVVKEEEISKAVEEVVVTEEEVSKAVEEVVVKEEEVSKAVEEVVVKEGEVSEEVEEVVVEEEVVSRAVEEVVVKEEEVSKAVEEVVVEEDVLKEDIVFIKERYQDEKVESKETKDLRHYHTWELSQNQTRFLEEVYEKSPEEYGDKEELNYFYEQAKEIICKDINEWIKRFTEKAHLYRTPTNEAKFEKIKLRYKQLITEHTEKLKEYENLEKATKEAKRVKEEEQRRQEIEDRKKFFAQFPQISISSPIKVIDKYFKNLKDQAEAEIWEWLRMLQVDPSLDTEQNKHIPLELKRILEEVEKNWEKARDWKAKDNALNENKEVPRATTPKKNLHRKKKNKC